MEGLTEFNVNFVSPSVNSNPDEKDTKTGDFSKKFYFNILLDDRAGFQPETDWLEICRIIDSFPQ